MRLLVIENDLRLATLIARLPSNCVKTMGLLR